MSVYTCAKWFRSELDKERDVAPVKASEISGIREDSSSTSEWVVDKVGGGDRSKAGG